MSEQEANLYVSKHLSSFLDTIKECEKEITVRCLDFKSYGFSACHLSRVVDFLLNSQTVELSLDGNDLSHALASVAGKLSRTKLQKFYISSKRLLESDLMCLASVLKDTSISDLELFDLEAIFTAEQAEEFVSHLRSSHLTKLAMQYCKFFKNAGAVCLVHSLPSTTITHLNLCNSLGDKVAFVFLWAVLPKTLITDLDLSCNGITDVELEALKQTLRESKLKRLNFEYNKISDAGVDILAKALVSSTVTDLSLGSNEISGKNNLGSYLKDTKINTLNLSSNMIKHTAMFSFPHFVKETSIRTLILESCNLNDQIGESIIRSLKFSKVVKLNLENNNFGLGTVSEFARVLKDTNLTHVNFSRNPISYKAFNILAQCLKGSKVKSIKFKDMKNLFRTIDGKKDLSTSIETFFENSKDSEISFVNFDWNFKSGSAEIFVKSLTGTTFTHLDLCFCSLGDVIIVNLAACMKFTYITHLNLSCNKVGDEGAEALAVCLPETQINTLDLSSTNITACGALCIASCLKRTSLYVLDLSDNSIDEKCIKDLAKTVEGTFVTEFKAGEDTDWQQFIIDPVLWKNRVSVHKLLEFVERIAPKTPDDDSFCFIHNDDTHMGVFLDECLCFCKTIQQPSAVNAVTHAGSVLPRKQVAKLFLEEYPRQLASFVGSSVKIEVEQRVRFLEKADKLQLTNVVNLLMLNRTAFMVHRNEGIFHPRVYKLLLKYNQPIFNSDSQEEHKVKIIKYLTEYAQSTLEVIKLLTNETIN